MIRKALSCLRNRLLNFFQIKAISNTITFQYLNVFVVNRGANRVLLGRRTDSALWELISGTIEPSDYSLEYAVIRAKNKEIGQSTICSVPKYLFSSQINDPRDKTARRQIISSVFKVEYIHGRPRALNDFFEVKWFSKDEIAMEYRQVVIPQHRELIKVLINLNELECFNREDEP